MHLRKGSEKVDWRGIPIRLACLVRRELQQLLQLLTIYT